MSHLAPSARGVRVQTYTRAINISSYAVLICSLGNSLHFKFHAYRRLAFLQSRMDGNESAKLSANDPAKCARPKRSFRWIPNHSVDFLNFFFRIALRIQVSSEDFEPRKEFYLEGCYAPGKMSRRLFFLVQQKVYIKHRFVVCSRSKNGKFNCSKRCREGRWWTFKLSLTR